MKKLLVLMTCLMTFGGAAFADTDNSLIAAANMPVAPQVSSTGSSITVPQPIRASLNQCFDTISMSSEQLFYLTMAALNNMHFKIKEVQSKTGTILFQAYSREFVITIADKGANRTFIKILPADSNYTFSPSLVQNIFGFLKANSETKVNIL
ncbi:MAG: hypothetical protein K6C94_02440 [Candidatus Gastranaerophilales bacterium]|nr:hypothetical protein [Candidatus Gastranaerophilales bacterium]